MRSNQSGWKYKQLLQQAAFIGVAASLCWASLVEASNVNSITANTSRSSNTIEIAEASTVCPADSGGSQFVSAETKNYLVYICGGDNPNTYVGMGKSGGNRITLPLQSYTKDRFIAVNGDTKYTLTRTQLTVTQKRKVIVSEAARWRR